MHRSAHLGHVAVERRVTHDDASQRSSHDRTRGHVCASRHDRRDASSRSRVHHLTEGAETQRKVRDLYTEPQSQTRTLLLLRGDPQELQHRDPDLASGAAEKSGGGASERVDRLRLRYDIRTHCVLNRGPESTT